MTTTTKIRVVGKREIPLRDTGAHYRPESMDSAVMQAYNNVVIYAERMGCHTYYMMFRIVAMYIATKICNRLMGRYR